MLHRDIKPENLILEPTGNAKLMDFGIARPIDRLAPGQTQAGFIVGTPQYMAPEQLEGEEADARADIYSCGVVLYEMFTGVLPFEGDEAMEIMVEQLSEEPARAAHPLARDPAGAGGGHPALPEEGPGERYRTVTELLSDLESLSA